MADEKPIPPVVKFVNENNVEGVESSILKGEPVDATDSNGMTALQHAAYKGQFTLCKLLLKYGASVNADSHDHRYSALHFAALSGHVEVAKLLLQSGAHTHHVNSLGRTAAQMAGFVGNHETVALINNYVPIEDIKYFTKIQGLETEARLDTALIAPIYDLIMQGNLHPVFHAIRFCCNDLLVGNVSQCGKILALMCEREAKRSDSVNEVICLKFHYLSYVLKTFAKEIQKDAEKKSTDALKELDLNTNKTSETTLIEPNSSIKEASTFKAEENTKNDVPKSDGNSENEAPNMLKTEEHVKTDPNTTKSVLNSQNQDTRKMEGEKNEKLILEPLIRKWLKSSSAGIEPFQRSFIIDAVKSFPYTEFPLFLQMVRHLSDGADALSILTGSINGQRAFNDNIVCSTCGAENSVTKKCSKCKCVRYCNRLCQRLHWGTHKRECDKLMKESIKAKLLDKKSERDSIIDDDKTVDCKDRPTVVESKECEGQ